MCGRAAQTIGMVYAASNSLKSEPNFQGKVVDNICPRVDNFNLSPGHDAVVITLNHKGELVLERKIWGLVTKGATRNSPIPEGKSKHFSNLMFNARADTLFEKPTFSRLLNERGKTCLVAFDGFFEWKPLIGKMKQPYFVSRKVPVDGIGTSRPYILMAGLWTSVNTGYSFPKPATLDTFAILTTEVCNPLKWLHSRMPVCVWDEALAVQWLKQPSQKLLRQLDEGANKTHGMMLQWHAVSTQMSSTKYRGTDSIVAIPKLKSIKSFFAPVGNSTTEKTKNVERKDTKNKIADAKRTVATSACQESNFYTQNKKQKSVKKGSISSFFLPSSGKS